MISRRLLRVKVMQALYAYLKSDSASINHSEKELQFSIHKTYELYIALFLLAVELSRYAEKRIDIARDKKIPNPEDLNPNTRFIENRLISQLKENQHIRSFVHNNKFSWSNQPELIKTLFNDLVHEEFYQNYMNSSEGGFDEDRKFIYELITQFFLASEDLQNSLEEQSIYWNDEIDYVVSVAGKTIKKFKASSGPETPLFPLYKNEEDAEFSKKLFRKVIVNQKDFEKLIEQFTKNWDFERIAFMDILILMLAIAEIQEFESIPVKVTFNEYIEISKLYSTEKSSIFINGILDKIIQHLKENNLFLKQGRGLIGGN
jgi:transcription antitermination protein NusB